MRHALLVLALVTLVAGQEKHEVVMDSASSPLQIKGTESSLDLTNRSKSAIVAYRLGCVVVQPSRRFIVFTFPLKGGTIEPGEGSFTGVRDGSVTEVVECSTRRAILAVVQIQAE